MLTEGRAGRIGAAPGAVNPLRTNHRGELNAVRGGKYQESTLNHNEFFAFCQTQDVALYNATAGIGLILFNPPASGVDAVLNKWSVTVWATSATMTGMVLAVTAQATVPATTTAATLTGSTHLHGATGLVPGQVIAYSIATILAPVYVWPLFHNTAAINTVAAEVIQGDLNGVFALAPGTVAVVGALGAAGVDVDLGITWEEVPVE